MASEAFEEGGPPQDGISSWDGAMWPANAQDQTSNTEDTDQATPPVPDSDHEEDDGGEYDPESITFPSAPSPAAEAHPQAQSVPVTTSQPNKKPKTAGGFVVNSSDDEDDEEADDAAPAASPNTLKPSPTPIQAPATTHSPLPQSTTPQNANTYTSTQPTSNVAAPSIPQASDSAPAKPRIPIDIVSILEDRIKEDPRGDLDAWLTLIEEQKRRNKIEEARNLYARFFQVFPRAAEIWVEYIDMELSLDNFSQAETIFANTILKIHHISLWTSYLNYVRRRNDLNNDSSGNSRQTVQQAYEFVLKNIGLDREAASIWQDYIQFLRNGPGGSSWMEQQKMDMLRKTYQRAFCIPMPTVPALWKDYDHFEASLNKTTHKKFLQEKSSAYITARSANTQLEGLMRDLRRTTLPRLPPVPGFEGEQEFMQQVRLWKGWIEWEKTDPLVLKNEDPALLQQRILFAYKQALMALQYWPEMWVDAAEWCFENDIKDGDTVLGLQFLIDGADANPESSLLALKHADFIEATQRTGEDDKSKKALSQAVREPFMKVLDTLYEMVKKLKDQEASVISKMESETAEAGLADSNTDTEGVNAVINSNRDRIKTVKDGFAVQVQMLAQQISHLWIAQARAMRRLEGQGKGSPPTGVRGIFTEARHRGRLTSDVYLAIAHIEWDIYQDPVATKIFERGTKLFPEQEHFIVEYLKHLHSKRDFTNARVVFSQTVKRFKEKPELLPKLKPLIAYFHKYESKYGELAQVKSLEKEMSELFPGDSSVTHFASRFSTEGFNPVTARVIVSPAQQMRPKQIMPSIEHHHQPGSDRQSIQPLPRADHSPRPQLPPVNNSPKRAYQPEEQDDYGPPRKIARGVSPLKGAAGRRLDQQRRAQGQGATTQTSTPAPLPREITFLLGIIPSAQVFPQDYYRDPNISHRAIQLIRKTPVPDHAEWKRTVEKMAGQHTQAASSKYPPFGTSDYTQPSRPLSPYGGGVGRVPPQVSNSYRNSPLRPGSSGSYEPPPAIYQGPGLSQFNPLSQVTDNGGYPGWQGYPTSAHQYSQSQHPSHYGGHY
ncbi:suppressor of forked protein-domain-containing protein [Xylariomycetidae sp. FL2044]|nr:suppressor of forked protein-domain-containing protein [Xylariomycetidae sp. FL2044]